MASSGVFFVNFRCKAPLFVLMSVLLALGVTAVYSVAPADIEKRMDDLLARMTLEEKLGQMSQGTLQGINERVRNEIRQGRWGSFLNGGTPQQKAELQRIALKESRLGIPLIFGQDVIHGYQTIFPIPLGQAASWDPDMVRQAARIAGREAAAAGIHWTFAPMMDIARDPRWGRIAESLGEDPYLAALMGAAMVKGFQGDALGAADAIAACAKHYVGYGAAEGGRDYNTTWIPENLLRDVYLAPFLAARQAGVATYMSAFNALNGVPTSGNEFTLRKILRSEWKFDGFVVSDYNSITEMIPHGYAADARQAALRGILAGVNMEMVSTSYFDNGKALIEGKQLDVKPIDEAVRNILRVKIRLGLFDNRGLAAPSAPAQPSPDALGIAQKLAAESLVLLKNKDNALPLAKSIGRLAVIGPLADSPRDQLGTWVLTGGEGSVTPLAALRKALGDARVAYAPGLKTSLDTSRDGFAAALDAARGADSVLMILGEEASLSGEANSRAFLDLPGAQEALVEEVGRSGKPMIAVIMAGRPLTFHGVAEKMNAVLYAWHPGTMGGPAIAEAILGNASPSGRLPATFPRTVGQVPLYYNALNTGRPASETGPNAKNRYTSKYVDVSLTPEYPFGFGLSYTRFEYANLRVSASQIKKGGSLTVTADITNAGQVEADEIIQFYTRQLAASLVRPVRELRAFTRLRLKPGEKRSVEFVLKTDDLAFHVGAKRVMEPGKFQVWIAPNAASGLQGQFEVTQ